MTVDGVVLAKHIDSGFVVQMGGLVFHYLDVIHCCNQQFLDNILTKNECCVYQIENTD